MAAHQANGELHGLGAGEVWRLFVPWAGHVFLVLAGLLGLYTASGAPDTATFATGLATFFIALLLIALRAKRQADGRPVGFLVTAVALDANMLTAIIAILVVLGLAGLILAARIGGELYGVGLALFVVSALLIFVNTKRYFDRLERGG